MVKQPSVASNLGLYVYAAGAMFLGVLGLVSGDFATTWQHVDRMFLTRTARLPHRGPRTHRGHCPPFAPYGASRRLRPHRHLFNLTLVWVPKALVNLGNYDPIGNVFEEFALVAAGLVSALPILLLAPTLRDIGPSSCSYSAFARSRLASFISWICRSPEPNPRLAAAVQNVLGLRHYAGLFCGRNLDPHGHFCTAGLATAHRGDRDLRVALLDSQSPRCAEQSFQLGGNAISIALAGAAWVVSDSISASAKAESSAVSRSVSAPLGA